MSHKDETRLMLQQVQQEGIGIFLSLLALRGFTGVSAQAGCLGKFDFDDISDALHTLITAEPLPSAWGSEGSPEAVSGHQN